MKIIDLLNKIANGEEVPKTIKHRNNIYEYFERLDDTFNYKEIIDGKYADDYLNDKYFMENILNDEIEIIEEDKLIEKMDEINPDNWCWVAQNKINELIDEVNKLKIGRTSNE